MEQAKAAVRALSCNQILRPLHPHQSSNCEREPDDNDSIPIAYPTRTVSTNNSASSSASSNPSQSEICVDFAWTDISKKTDAVEEDVLNYVLGSIIRRFVSCDACLNNMTSSSETQPNDFLKNKTLPGCNMICPKLVPVITNIRNFVFLSLPSIGHIENISLTLKVECEKIFEIDFDFLHDKCKSSLSDTVLLEIVKFFLRVYCKRRNEKLKRNEMSKSKTQVKRWTRSTNSNV